MRDLVADDPSDAAVVHVAGPVGPEEVALQDPGGELDAVLDGGVEGVHHGRGAVPLPVSLVHLMGVKKVITNMKYVVKHKSAKLL